MVDNFKSTASDHQPAAIRAEGETGQRNSQDRPERQHTDESLLAERANADQVLRVKHSELERHADLVVGRARDTADALLTEARERVDARGLASQPPDVVAADRAHEDSVLRAERASTDDMLQQERAASTRALARLIPLEREKTDRYLLTERTRSDEDLTHRDDFLGIVSHDLRNLLSGIVLSTTLLSDAAPPTEEGKRTLAAAGRIQRYAARMNRLIGDLVDVASIDAGALSLSLGQFDTSALIDEAVDMFSGLAHAKGLTLASDISERPLPATFDHDRMIQVLANLVTNAIKFTSVGSVVIRNERTAGGCRISVVDTGMGIPSDKLEMVFQRFWQVGKNDRRGVGLGLYISRCIVEAHGGTISATSADGSGTTFACELKT